jgi:hypothetical protein
MYNVLYHANVGADFVFPGGSHRSGLLRWSSLPRCMSLATLSSRTWLTLVKNGGHAARAFKSGLAEKLEQGMNSQERNSRGLVSPTELLFFAIPRAAAGSSFVDTGLQGKYSLVSGQENR